MSLLVYRSLYTHLKGREGETKDNNRAGIVEYYIM